MNSKFYQQKFELSQEREEKLWNDSVIVFDTSALIDFYYYPEDTRKEIYNKILKILKDRLWIPHHVQFEYLKNRKNVIRKPVEEKYGPLKKEKIKNLIGAKDLIMQISEQIHKDTKKSEKHPFLPQNKINEFLHFTEEIDDKVKQFEKDLLMEIDKQETQIKSLLVNDTILSTFESFLKVGEEFNFSKIMEIVSEGKLRYEFKIPPGYLDAKDKVGTQIFGDLIVWKQILEFSKSENKNIIFVCNDLKLDWCYTDSRKRIESPRPELIKEFYDYTSKEFWMYDQSQFLVKANNYLKTNVETRKIEEISKVIDTRNEVDLSFRCGNCGHINKIPFEQLNLDFDCVDSSPRNMGAENQYQSDETSLCAKCGHQIDIFLQIWEYPEGVHNYENIEIENGEIIDSPGFVGHFWKNY
ncbi:PIN-like domain-containing protein [Sphingobacterium sp. SG20118]|uniref:PIN-like domain-containing protein n=1 Tax=Sphingobacterium sp. SG20118 TaxID=3367156 RepID=UPI0037DFC3B3